MNLILHWKKDFFSSSYSIYSADGKIGQLNENPIYPITNNQSLITLPHYSYLKQVTGLPWAAWYILPAMVMLVTTKIIRTE